ncbi:MAG: hypothetical protein WDN45_04190 [Caulobacteraceae bacterium]
MRIGPNLWGVVGRKAGITPHFRYSAAMMQSGIVWTPDRLRPYIHDPQGDHPQHPHELHGTEEPEGRRRRGRLPADVQVALCRDRPRARKSRASLRKGG